MKRILIIEDDKAIRRGLVDNLAYEGYDVRAAEDAETGIGVLAEFHPHVLILDIMLPGMTGYELCRSLRREGNRIPILILSAKGQEFDRIMGLDLGADDYVTKPFSILELLARIRALVRRGEPVDPLPDALHLGDVQVDFRKFETTRAGEAVALSRKEYGLLRVLASRPGEVFSRDELLDRVWGEDHYPSTRTVDNHVSMLRSKLEEDPSHPVRLVTMHGVGYKLVPDD